MNVLPVQAQLAIAAAALALSFGVGFGLERVLKNGEIDSLNLSFEKKVNEANQKTLVANKRADDAEAAQRATLAAKATEYEVTRQKEKAQDEKTIADLRGAVVRLRVSTTPVVVSGQVSGSATCACGSNGQAQQTLSPAVAARLAGRYADYNGLVDELNLCQDTLISDRMLNAPSAK